GTRRPAVGHGRGRVHPAPDRRPRRRGRGHAGADRRPRDRCSDARAGDQPARRAGGRRLRARAGGGARRRIRPRPAARALEALQGAGAGAEQVRHVGGGDWGVGIRKSGPPTTPTTNYQPPTSNLQPPTDSPTRPMSLAPSYDPGTFESRIYAEWEAAGVFAPRGDGPAYTILLPPPNVTGTLHMGHAFQHTLQDALIRYHRMLGHRTLWQVGSDHAGIATERVVSRNLAIAGNGETRASLGREGFIGKVWEWKQQSGDTIERQMRRMGASGDWSRKVFTMDEGPSKAVIEAFVRLHEQGLIYRGKRLVIWDPVLNTAISDLEVENREVPGHMWHFKYPLAGGETYEYVERDADGNVTLRETRDYISIATTRPETMLGDGAVAVHPSDARYAPIVGKL